MIQAFKTFLYFYVHAPQHTLVLALF